MAIIAQDNFNRANSTTLGTAPTGQVWQQYGGQWGIQNNTAYPVTPIYDSATYIDAGVSDNIAYQITMGVFSTETQIYYRIQSVTNHFLIEDGFVYLGANGNWTQIASIGTTPNGSVVRVELRGTQHQIFVDGELRATFTNTNYQTATYFGFSTGQTTTRLDDFLIEDFAVADTTPPSQVTNFTALRTDYYLSLEWTNPTDPDFSYVQIKRDGVVIADNITRNTYYDGNRANGTTYTYEIRTIDTSGNIGEPVIQSFTTEDYPTENITEDFKDTLYNIQPIETGWTQRDSWYTEFYDDSGYLFSALLAGDDPDVLDPMIATFYIKVPQGTLRSYIEVDWGFEASGTEIDFSMVTEDGVVQEKLTGGYFGSGTWTLDVPTGSHPVDFIVHRKSPSSYGTAYIFEIRLIHEWEVDTTPPNPVSNFRTTSNTVNSITLAWGNPTDSDFSHVRLARDGTLIEENITATTFTDTGLEASTDYLYEIWTVDGSGNIGAPSSGTFRTANPPYTVIGEFRTRTGEQVSIYHLSGDPTQPLRIETSEGTGFIKLVPASDSKATRIRQYTSRGMEAWEGVTLVTELVVNGGTFQNTSFSRTFDGSGFNTTEFTTVIDGGTF